MNILWLIRGFSDFENIGPFILRASTLNKNLKFYVVLDGQNAAHSASLIASLDKLHELMDFQICELPGSSNKTVRKFLSENSIQTMVLDWGSGYPTSIVCHIKWILSKKKYSLRSKFIKFGRKNNIRMICLPHAISMHVSASIKPKKLVRRLVNAITSSEVIEDYSDRNIFDFLLFYNKIQQSNYERFYNLSSGNLGLAYIYKYESQWVDAFYPAATSADSCVVFSIPKLHNKINLNQILVTLDLIGQYCRSNSKKVVCAIHPRVNVSSLPNALLAVLNDPFFEVYTLPFSSILKQTSMLLDAGSSIMLDALSLRVPTIYLAYLDENEIVEIQDDNFYIANQADQLGELLSVGSSTTQFHVPVTYVEGNRYRAEALLCDGGGDWK